MVSFSKDEKCEKRETFVFVLKITLKYFFIFFHRAKFHKMVLFQLTPFLKKMSL
jgi:hypothetical protein